MGCCQIRQNRDTTQKKLPTSHRCPTFLLSRLLSWLSPFSLSLLFLSERKYTESVVACRQAQSTRNQYSMTHKESPLRDGRSSSSSSCCTVHHPTVAELKRTTFTKYIQEVVFSAAVATEKSSNKKKLSLSQGIAKIQFPKNFFHFKYDSNDTSGRGPSWEALPLVFTSPIQQHLRGMTGVYEYTHTDCRSKQSMTLSELRAAADAYQANVSSIPTDDDEKLARHFWKRVSPTMPPPTYAADEPGTLFATTSDNSDIADDWAVSNLDSCLHLLDGIPGVTSPYLYGGMWGTVFCAHTEDMHLLSINYLHAGAPKLWYAVAEPDAARFESLADHHYNKASTECSEYLRHKRTLLSPARLQKAGIRVTTTVQYPGQAVITFPGSYHFGFNAGFNVAEATNFAVPEWIPFGRSARVCLCRPDSVQIQMDPLEGLLEQYDKETNGGETMSYRAWRKRQKDRAAAAAGGGGGAPATSQQPAAIITSADTIPPSSSSSEALVVASPKKKKRKKRPRKDLLSEQERKQEFWVELTGQRNVWRLARPVKTISSLTVDTRVLCFLALTKTEDTCFAGSIVQRDGGHVRVHLDGLRRSKDLWMEVSSPQLFLDGGLWEDEEYCMPELHYWKESDSKRIRGEGDEET